MAEAQDASAQRMVHTAARLAQYRQWVLGMPPHDALSAIYEDAGVLARFAEVAPAAQRAGVLAALRDVLAQSLAQELGWLADITEGRKPFAAAAHCLCEAP